MGIHKTRQQCVARPLDGGFDLKSPADVALGQDADDPATGDHDRMVVQDRAGRFDRHDPAGGNDEVSLVGSIVRASAVGILPDRGAR